MRNESLFLSVVSGVALAVSSAAMAGDKGMSKEAKIKKAMSAGPAQITKDATVVDPDGTVVRKGSNGWTCMASMGPGMDVPMCNDKVWMDFMGAFAAKKAPNPTQVGVSYMFGGDIPTNNDDPFDTTQDPGEPWVTEGPHIMIIVPNAKEALKDMTNDPNAGGPYVMYRDTPYAHIMVPTGPRAQHAKK